MIEEVCERIVRHGRPDLVPRAQYFDKLLKSGWGVPRDSSIVQLGCACGYMLDVLKTHSYTNLLGVDNDPDMEKDWMKGVKFICSTARWALQTLPKPDVLLFHRFLFTLPPTERTKELYSLIAKGFKRFLITVEEESGIQITGKPAVYFNNYKDIFEKLGCVQVFEDTSFCKEVVFRVFTHEQTITSTEEN